MFDINHKVENSLTCLLRHCPHTGRKSCGSFDARPGGEEDRPGGKRSLKSQLPGAVFCFVCWMVFTFVFVKFLPLFWKSSVYGSLASIFLFITWARILFLILFLGGALNGALADEQNGTGV